MLRRIRSCFLQGAQPKTEVLNGAVACVFHLSDQEAGAAGLKSLEDNLVTKEDFEAVQAMCQAFLSQ
jgi:hypothetical protein